MLSDDEIQELLDRSKAIVRKTPRSGYRSEAGHRRADLDVEAANGSGAALFSVFIRQNERFIENFSIGLRYRSNMAGLGDVTLVRYNGPHGDMSIHADGHRAKPHIHRITSVELASGSREPRERDRAITDRYTTLDTALRAFFDDLNVMGVQQFFPELSQGQLFNEQ